MTGSEPADLEFPNELEGRIEWLVRDTGKSAEVLKLRWASELVELGSGAIKSLIGHWCHAWENELVTARTFVSRDAGWAEKVARLRELLPYARTSLTLPLDRGRFHFAAQYCWVFALDSVDGVWRWRSVRVLSQDFTRVCIDYSPNATRNLPIASPLIITDNDRRVIRAELQGHVPWWLQASVGVKDLRPGEAKALHRESVKG